MNGTEEHEAVLARLKAIRDSIKGLKPGKNDAVVAVLQEVLGYLGAVGAPEVVVVAIKLLEDSVVLSPQAGTVLRLEGGLKVVVRHLKGSIAVASIAGPCARILALAAATSTVTQQALAKEKGLGSALLSACALNIRDAAIASALAEAMAHISKSVRGAAQLCCEQLLPVLQDLLNAYMGNWPVLAWALKVAKNVAKYEHTTYGTAASANGGSTSQAAQVPQRGVLSASGGGEAVRLLLGVARVLARMPEQRKLLKRVSRTLWLLCPHLLVPLPPLEPLTPLPGKDAPHLTVQSASEADAQRHQELFPEEYPWQQQPLPPLHGAALAAGPGWGGGGGGGGGTWQPSGGGGGAGGLEPGNLTIRPPAQLPAAPPSAREVTRCLARAAAPDRPNPGLGRTPEPFHSYGNSLECDMMVHDLQRIASPKNLLNRIVYLNTGAAPSPVPLRYGTTQEGWAADGSGSRSKSGLGALPDLSRLLLQSGGAGSDTQGASTDVSRCSTAATSAAAPSESASSSIVHLPDIRGADPWARHTSSAANGVHGSGGGGGGGGGGGAVGHLAAVLGGVPDSRPASNREGWGQCPPLVFNSCFETGNLRCAAQVGPREYDLFLAPDLNDRSEGGNLCQWFYFAVTVPPEACGGSSSNGGSGSGGGSSSGEAQWATAPPGRAVQGAGSEDGGGSGQQPPMAGGALTGGGAGAGQGGGSGPGIRFNLVNLKKKESLFAMGKRPVMCLAKLGVGAAGSSLGGGRGALGRCEPADAPPLGVWLRAGSSISYYPSPYRGRATVVGEGAGSRKGKKTSAAVAASGPAAGSGAAAAKKSKAASGKGSKAAAAAAAGGDGEDAALSGAGSGWSIGPGLYCASFTIHFAVPGTYYIASCYPYTYTDLQEYLDSLQRRLNAPPTPQQQQPPLSPPPMVRSALCYSLFGLRAELLTITDWAAPLEHVRQRECIVITARVHPGETCASWIMQGIIEFLTSSDPAAATLRSSFVFKLVPCLNPDGVVNGNYRCSLAGTDLNRVWDRPMRAVHPTVYHAKRLMQQLAAAGRLALYIDIHGHSTKSDTFFYGCEPGSGALQSPGSARDLRTSAAAPPPAAAAAATAAAAAAAGLRSGLDTPADAPASPYPYAYPPSSAASSSQAGPLNIQGAGIGPAHGGSPAGVVAGGPAAAGQAQQQQAAGASRGAAGATGGGVGPSGPGQQGAAVAPVLSARTAARLRVRMLPYLTSRISSDYNIAKCNYKVRKCKMSAARVVVHRELGVAGSYTLEASLGGGSASGLHFGVRDYLAMGHSLCRAICELAEVDDGVLLQEMHSRITLQAL